MRKEKSAEKMWERKRGKQKGRLTWKETEKERDIKEERYKAEDGLEKERKDWERKGGGRGYGAGFYRRQLFLVLTIVLNQQEIF